MVSALKSADSSWARTGGETRWSLKSVRVCEDTARSFAALCLKQTFTRHPRSSLHRLRWQSPPGAVCLHDIYSCKLHMTSQGWPIKDCESSWALLAEIVLWIKGTWMHLCITPPRLQPSFSKMQACQVCPRRPSLPSLHSWNILISHFSEKRFKGRGLFPVKSEFGTSSVLIKTREWFYYIPYLHTSYF